MRILQVAWEYPPVIEGGLGRHVAKLSAALAEAGHEVHVLTRGDVPEQELAGVQVHRVEIPPFSSEMDAFMAWVGELNARLAARGRELVDSERFDLVHSHDWLVATAAEQLARPAAAEQLAPPAAEQLARPAAVPWLVTVHATEFGRHNGWVHTHPQRAIHLTERHMVRHADHVICCSEYMAGHVRRVFGVDAGHVRAIPNGIDFSDLEPGAGTDLVALRRRYAADGERLVLMVGRLVYEKGFHVALDALAPLIAADPRIRFAMAGTGTAEADLKAQAAALGLVRSGRFLGRINDTLLHALYRVADVVVVPSLYEPFGIVPLEAMASGCPVVVTDTGGLREVVAGSDAAWRCPPGDATALAAALADVLADPDRRQRMRVAGLAHAVRFDWAAVAEQTAGTYAALFSPTQLLEV